MLGGCQLEPTVEFLPLTPPPTITFPPTETSEQQPKLADIANHMFSATKDSSIVGDLVVINTQEGDILPDIARHFGLGYNEITLANPNIHPWMSKAGEPVLLPLQFILPDTPRKGIVLNLANMRMFYYHTKQKDVLFTYPVGVGRDGWNTPLGQTSLIAKKIKPTWVVPESVRREHAAKGDPLPGVVHPGPKNPLGEYALLLGFSNYLIHGTNKPYGVGMQVSHGCVRLYPEDIEVLFKKTLVGTPVRIIHQPYMMAWKEDMLYLEAHQPLKKWAGQKERQQKSLMKQLNDSAAKKGVTVDWDKVDSILKRADGIPTPILTASPDLSELIKQAPEVQHPGHFYGQLTVPEVTDSDWAILVADFDNEQTAQILAAMLNHQGPPIPARKVEEKGSYQVIAGPFKNQKEAEWVVHRLKIDFEIDAKPLPPITLTIP